MAGETLPKYTRIDYILDVNLIRRFGELQRMHEINPAAPWEEDTRELLRTRQKRLRTKEGHMPEGPNASFSDVYSEDVTDPQAYAVLVKKAEAARERAEQFRIINARVSRDSSLERIANAVHIADIDANNARTNELTYMLGEMLVAMNKTDLARAKRVLGHDLVERAYAKVQPSLL